ncbi:hypothetical protein [Halosimplex pelagicum]|uniref:Uncharacterized protein n=1 Tax=Halosimplex pelagicum TaxID=869886 RepID=A0A7D5PC16_9EURY|nr:hypothetical protein [Halosimplex pelagicum]QLH84661.1 hypothetical protein HZS54_24795 [Halosimplex pelagicum]
MKRNWRLVVGGIAVLLILLVGLGLGVVAVESGTTVESTVVTSQAGNVTATGSDLVFHVDGDSRFAAGVSERLEARLADEGYAVRTVESLDADYESPVLVVNVTRAEIDSGMVAHNATLEVETYYATDWNRTTYEAARESGSVELRGRDTAVVEGEFRIRDRTRGLPGRYLGQLTGEIVDAVAESFRADLPR